MTEKKDDHQDEIKTGEVVESSRRDFFKTTAVGLAGAGALTMGILPFGAAKDAEASSNTGPKEHVGPGELDEYYGFWSGGQSGEVRIIGIPSGRELKRIPVFNWDAAYGWGTTNFSKTQMRGSISGDTHHVHLSYKNGTYDGKYGFVNDKSQARLARIRLDMLVTDKIVDIPNAAGTHGIFPSRNEMNAVYCNSEFRIPLPNDGSGDLEDSTKYGCLHSCIDAESMEVRWQIMVDGNLDLCATDYHGKYSMACCYNSEEGVVLSEMMAKDRDWLIVFNLERIEAAIKAGKGTTIGDSKVPVLDGRGDSEYTLRIPVPKSPHGVNVDPTGKYAVCSGKLSPTVSVVELSKVDKAFAGKIKPRDCVIAEPEVGLGPLHTAFDNRGNAYTSIFLDSVVTKWNIAKAVAGENPVIEKVDVNYQIGHINASMSETKDADGNWMVALCKFSKDRFLPVGPFRAENEQLFNISGKKMKMVHEGAAHAEPHDALIVSRDLIRPEKVWTHEDSRFDFERELAKKHGVNLQAAANVITEGNHTYVFMVGIAPAFSLSKFNVPLGNTVTVVLTNMDGVEDLSHGFCLTQHDINFGVSPRETASVTFKADKKGVFWYYCPWFCHALHLEMRGRMIVS